MCSHGQKPKNVLKLFKKYFFSSCAIEAHVKLTLEYDQKPTFIAFRSDTQELVAPERFRLKSIN